MEQTQYFLISQQLVVELVEEIITTVVDHLVALVEALQTGEIKLEEQHYNQHPLLEDMVMLAEDTHQTFV
jgi:hypothetical protein